MDNTHITGDMAIEDDVVVSVLVSTTNDNAMGAKGWHDAIHGPIIRKGASIGVGANLLPSVEVGRSAIVGASSVVTRNVPDYALVMGVPSRFRNWICPRGQELSFQASSYTQCGCGKAYFLSKENTVKEVT